MKGRFVTVCLIVWILFGQGLIAEAKQHSAVSPAHRHSWWTLRNDAVNERVKHGNVDLLFIGDSITHGWEGGGKKYWDQYYAPRNAVNMGFGGDRTQHVLWRLDNGHLEGISPKLAVLMIGTNNSNGNDNTAEEIADGIVAICNRLRTKCPKTRILILAIFPRGPEPSAQRQKNAEASLLASKIADGKMIHYLDINDKFLGEDGSLSKEIMPDHLHPNEAGYKIWAQAIEPKVAELMGESGRTKNGFVALFNGENLSGWEATGNASWTVENGQLIGTQGRNNAPGDLFTTASYSDFELIATYRAEWPCNSGVWFRFQSPGKAYQADILEWKDPVCYSGTLYCPGKMFLAMNTDKELVNRTGWNTMKVRAQGRNIKIWLNGRQVANVDDDTTDSGKIGFQVHPGAEFGPMKIVVKEVLIKPLNVGP
ncbi:MAG: DUF1080 domain-containing protein [Phycisphaerales bacterium]|nr:MAG: DUF1080 domain-containing protein [Phycisphaerales bacterium]